MNYETLLTPYNLAGFELPNRIVMPPLVIWQADESAEVTEHHLAHYRSCVGPGLMIVEATTVAPEGRLRETQLGIFEDRHVAGLSRLAEIIHTAGAVAGIQIHHAGGKATLKTTYGLQPLAPSVGDGTPASKESAALTTEDIRRIQDDFVTATERSIRAGFDLIELHGAHGYLGSQFLSPYSNRRTDQYGGSSAGRRRFLIELFHRCRETADDRAKVYFRLGVTDKDGQGLTLEEGTATAAVLQEEGMELIHVSSCHGVSESVRPEGSRHSALIHLAGAVKQRVTMPVIGVGGINTPEAAQAVLDDGMADLVAVGRGLLADPEWVRKTIENREDEIELCRRCSPCFWFRNPSACPARKALGRVFPPS